VALEIAEVRYDDPVVQELTREVQAEYGRRYGGDGDSSPMDPARFAPPHGRFFLATLDVEPVGMGGWRWGGPRDGDAEIKRMYVSPAHRGRGHARAVLAELERTAAAAGRRRVVLETGTRQRAGIARAVLAELERTAKEAGVRRLVLETGNAQPEAIAMYRLAGFVDIPAFGHYAHSPDAVHLGKGLE
jgi:ribosomal protein S18 acetylase RimI-like enzyme